MPLDAGDVRDYVGLAVKPAGMDGLAVTGGWAAWSVTRDLQARGGVRGELCIKKVGPGSLMLSLVLYVVHVLPGAQVEV